MQIYRHTQGNTFTSRIALKNSVTGEYVDLSGWTVQQHVREAKSFDLLVKLEDYAVLDPENPSVVHLSVPATVTAQWPANTYFSDIKITDPAGTVVSSGKITIVIEEGITT